MPDTPGMQCYCEHKKHVDKKYTKCPNLIPYVNHHDWGRDEDFMCEDCLNNCLEDREC